MTSAAENSDGIAFHVREASSEDGANDAALLRALIQELADFIRKPDGPKISADQLRQYLKDGTAKALIATATTEKDGTTNCDNKEGEMVAANAIYYVYPSIEFGRVFFLDELFIQPVFRRHKLGSKLMRTLTAISRDLRCDSFMWTVRSFNIGAIRFYESIGAKELTAKSADGRPTKNCWGILSSEFCKMLQNSKGDLSGIEVNVLKDGQVKERTAQLAEDWFSMDAKLADNAEKEIFSRALQAHGFYAVRAQNMSGTLLGLALFHRCAFSSWIGPYLTVDCLKVRSDCRRRRIGKQMAGEMARIAVEWNCPKINWIANAEDPALDAFFGSFGAKNLTEKECCLLFMLSNTE